jgi:protein disulfide-isomerase
MRAAVTVLVLAIIALVVAVLLAPAATRPDPAVLVPRSPSPPHDGWETSWHRARERAATEGRPILANFTGSDWCPPCGRLHRTVFASPDFRAWAERRVVLLEVDFPAQAAQTPGMKAQNRALEKLYGIAGFPTVLVLEADGSLRGQVELAGAMDGVAGWLTAVEPLIAASAPSRK